MAELPSNSFASKAAATAKKERKKPVAKGVALKKKSEIKKFTDIFFAEDLDTVKNFLVSDVIIPSVKKIFYDMITGGARMLLYSEKAPDSKPGAASKVSYRSYYERERDREAFRDPHKAKMSAFNYDEITFSSRGAAEAVLTAMEEAIEQYRSVSVLDLYDFAEVTTNDYTADKYGWVDLHKAEVVPTREGYVLKLPRAVPLN